MTAPNSSAQTKTDQSSFDFVGHLDQVAQSIPDQYFDHFLKVAEAVTGATAGQVWGLSQQGEMSRIHARDVEQFSQLDHPDVVNAHRELISQVLVTGKTNHVPYSVRGANPDEARVLMLTPLFLESDPVGVVELILPSELDTSHRNQLNSVLKHASNFLLVRASLPQPSADPPQHSRAKENGFDNAPASLNDGSRSSTAARAATLAPNPAHASTPTPDPTPAPGAPATSDSRSACELTRAEIESVIWQLHQQPELSHVSSTAVNEVRRLLDADRVSLAISRNGSVEVIAISGQDSIVNKSNTVRVIECIAKSAIETGQQITLSPENPADGLPTGLENEHVIDYFSETGSAGLAVLPLEKTSETDNKSNAEKDASSEPFAALMIESFSARPQNVDQISRLLPHIAQATANSIDQEQIFLLPLRRKLGRWIKLSKIGKNKLRLIGAGVLIAVLVMALVHVPYRVQATGKLMPVQQYRAYAPMDGEVAQVFVRSGQFVSPDEPLLLLHDESLETQLLVTGNSIAERKKLSTAYRAQLDEQSNTLSQTDRIGLSANIAQNEIEIQGLEQRQNGLLRQKNRALLRADISGTVATFRPDDLLSGRPVGRGELLIEVMNESGPWNLELLLPEKRFGKLLQSNVNDPANLSVTFVQATSPEKTWTATVQEIATRATMQPDGSSAILIHASIDDGQSIRQTIGAEVIAKIDCGNKSLGYVCFGDVLDWFRSKCW